VLAGILVNEGRAENGDSLVVSGKHALDTHVESGTELLGKLTLNKANLLQEIEMRKLGNLESVNISVGSGVDGLELRLLSNMEL
jgi:hypothetical protein